MPYDANAIAPAARDRLTGIGRSYSSEDVAEQVAATRNGLEQFRAELERYGFDPSDETELTDAETAHSAARVERDSAKGTRKVTNAELVNHVFDSKGLRLRVRSVLTTARSKAERAGDTAAVNAIEAVLGSTSSAGADPELLRRQLLLLAEVLGHAAVGPKIPSAAGLVSTLTAQSTSLEAAEAAGTTGRGTPTQTAQLDLLDGYLVELCRAARRAARAAARDLGRPEIAKAFELWALYRTTRRRRPEDPAPPA